MKKYCQDILTLDILDQLSCDEVFASGTFMDSYDDIPLCCPISNKEVYWIAIKGMRHKLNGFSDWCIYASNPHFTALDFLTYQIFHGEEMVKDIYWTDENLKKYGDKIHDIKNIFKLLPCDTEVLKRYRY